MMPMIHGLLSKWIPPAERGRASSYILGGMLVGKYQVILS